MSSITSYFRLFLLLYLCTELLSSTAPKLSKYELVRSEATNPHYPFLTQIVEQSPQPKKQRKIKKNPKRKRKKEQDAMKLDESSFMAMMGNDFMTDWMALDNPYKTKSSESAEDLYIPGKWEKHELVKQMNKLNLTQELTELAPDLLHLESQIRQYLLKRSSCPTNFTWFDLGHTFWPRWIRRGECNSREGVCSFPTGMNCVPNTSKTVFVLQWICENEKERASRNVDDKAWVETIVEYTQSLSPRERRRQNKGRKRENKDKKGKIKDKKGKNRDKREVTDMINKRPKRRVLPLRLWGSLLHRKPVPLIPKTKRKGKCNWQKVPYTITIDCFCGC